VLLLAIQAKRVLEIGSLGGYSGCLARARVASRGELTTIEKDPKHAKIARDSFDLARLHGRVQLIEDRRSTCYRGCRPA